MHAAGAISLLLALTVALPSAAAQDYTRPLVKVPDAATSFPMPGETPPPAEERRQNADTAGEQKVQCISIDAIRQATIKNDRVIHLRMRGGLFYEMRLQNSCPGLSFYDGFYYRTTPNRQLCGGLDMIMARSGSRCPIDSFVRIEKPESRKDKKDRKVAGKEPAKEKAGKSGS